MRVLMFGWEFPPVYSGGLGTACYGLTKGLSKQGCQVTFVMPKGPGSIHHDHVEVIVADNVRIENIDFKQVPSLLVPYLTSGGYDQRYKKLLQSSDRKGHGSLYGKNMGEEVWRYSEIAKLIAEAEDFDIIHAHDWMTYMAGIKAKKASGKPLVVHIHATEFDRSGFNGVNQWVFDLERQGFQEADRILAVSNYTKNIVVTQYGVPEHKVEVVHNAVEFTEFPDIVKKEGEKMVLFLGRITLQKGPEYFIQAAKKVLDIDPSVKFVVAGNGDMMGRMVEMAAHYGIANKVLFAGFLRGKQIDEAYKMADLYVLPSVSEPFGITPLEAMRNGTPCLISKTSGVSEVVNHCLKVDFWDIDEMANKIVGVLNYAALKSELQENGNKEVRKFNWEIPAQKCVRAYNNVLSART